MKNIIIYSALALSTLTMSSCYDLDRYPADQLSSGSFFQNEDHAKKAIMGAYAAMKSDNAFGLQFSMDVLGGLGVGYDPQSYINIAQGTYDLNNGQVLSKWGYLYEGVTRTNIVLQNVDKTDMSDVLKARYKGEAKFLRALYYFTLMDYFGAVPVYDENTVISKQYNDLKQPRNSVEEVRKFILADLDEAIQSLPKASEWAEADRGRATKGAAIALKGKVLLYAKDYKGASEAFAQIISDPQKGEYDLYPNYADLFKPEGHNSNEMIFAIQNLGGTGVDLGMPMAHYMGSNVAYGYGWNNVMASTYFVDSYEYKDGKTFKWDDILPGYTGSNDDKKKIFFATITDGKVSQYPADKDQLLAMYAKRDPRMSATIILPYTIYKGNRKNINQDFEYVIAKNISADNGYLYPNGGHLCYLWRKFVPEYNMNGAITHRDHTPINFPIIRYADVLLMQAECLNELGQQTEAVALINRVRDRSGMALINNGDEWMAATTKDQVFARIRHERAVELAAEGWSFSDMKRWGLLTTLDGRIETDVLGAKKLTRVISKRDMLWPIPGSEIDKNPNLLPNNPGW